MAKNFNSSALPEHCYAVLPGSGQLSARCPNVSPIAPNKMDFPAPVSPVIIVNPFSSPIFVLSIKA